MVAPTKQVHIAPPPSTTPELREVHERLLREAVDILRTEAKPGPLIRALERLHRYIRGVIEAKEAQIAEARRAAETSATAHTVRPSVQALAKAITPASGSVLPESTAYAQAIWQSGYEQGVKDTMKLVRREIAKSQADAPARLEALRNETAELARAAIARVTPPTGETPQQKSARLRRTARFIRDEQQVIEFAKLVASGDTTEQARQRMKIGVLRAQRLRALAVKMGLLQPRQRGSEA